MAASEHQLYEQVARYMQLQYPEVVYRFDLAADLKLTPGQAVKHKRLHPFRGFPDMFIAEPSLSTDIRLIRAGLFIELKKEGTRLKKKDGTWASNHIAEQAEMLNILEFRGYKAVFCVGFDEAKKAIDDYLKGAGL